MTFPRRVSLFTHQEVRPELSEGKMCVWTDLSGDIGGIATIVSEWIAGARSASFPDWSAYMLYILVRLLILAYRSCFSVTEPNKSSIGRIIDAHPTRVGG